MDEELEGLSLAELEARLMRPSGTNEEPEAEPQTPAEEAEGPKVLDWDGVLPDDPTLPDTYRGKKSLRELWEERRELRHKESYLGMRNNELEAELRAARATLELLKPNLQKQEEKPQRIVDRVGVDLNREIVVDPENALERYGQTLVDETTRRTKTEIETVKEQLRQIQTREEVNQARVAAEAARQRVNQSLVSNGYAELSPQEWEQRLGDMFVHLVNDPRENALFNPEVYIEHHNKVLNRWGIPQTPQKQAARVQVQGSSGVAAGPGTVSNAGLKPGVSKRVKAEAEKMAKLFGLPYEKIESKILDGSFDFDGGY